MRLPYTGILGEILGSFASLRELPRPFATLRLCVKFYEALKQQFLNPESLSDTTQNTCPGDLSKLY